MSYAQFGYTAFPPTSQLMVGTNNSSGAPGSPCCETGGRSSATTIPAEAQTAVCSLPATYDSRLLSTYPRLTSAGLYSGPTYADQPYPNFDSSAFYPSLGSAYAMKDPTDPWRGIGPSASYYYDSSLAAYGYGGLDFNGARRKNVTRDSTSTLKAWLNEHRKNPYPTKGEKIMLAIITKMTLTQVSTWFANARRRLKKENKMTWEPRNKIDADDIKDYEDDDLDDDDNNNDPKEIKNNNNNSDRCSGDDRDSKGIAGGDPPTRIGVRRESIRGESERGEGCADVDRRLTPGRPSNGKSDGYPMLRHPTNNISEELSRLPLASCATSERHLNPHIPTESPLLAPDFTPSDSSSPSLPDMQTFIRSPGETPMGTRVTGRSPVSAISPSPADSGSHNNNNSSTNASTNIDLGDPESHHHTKPKIWSLADTATSKSPAPSSASLTEVNSPGSMTDMLGHCGWFSVNPYQVNASPSSLGGLVGNHGYPPSFAAPSTNGGMFGSAGPGPASVAAAAAAAAAYGHGFSPLPPQTDTPPQTPPNLKMSAALPLSVNSANYLSGQAAHLYLGQAAASGMCSGSTLSNMQVGKNGGIYSLGYLSSSGRSYRSDTPADYSSSAGLRSTSIQ